MLRSIPNKVTGVCVMLLAIIILFFLPLIPFRCKSSSFCLLSQFFFWCFVLNFICLGWLAAHPVVFPFTVLSGVTTCFYFFYLLVLLPGLAFVEYGSIVDKLPVAKKRLFIK
jgi:quinol-cytochrome oxidoreductase complex cytochrome b subunit